MGQLSVMLIFSIKKIIVPDQVYGTSDVADLITGWSATRANVMKKVFLGKLITGRIPG